MEVHGRVIAWHNEVTICWVPANNGIPDNEKADEFAKAAASRAAPCSDDDILDELRWEASLSHMIRSATEARTCASAEWVASHVRSQCRYRTPLGRGLRRKHLRNTRKELAGRCYQLLSGHGSFGSYLKRMKKVDSDRC